MEGSAAGAASGPPANGRTDVYRYLLLLRFVLLNAACFGILGAAWLQGWLDPMLASPARLMCLGIFATFLAGLAICTAKVARTSVELNRVRAGSPAPGSRAARHLERVAGAAGEGAAGADGGGEARRLAADLLRLRMANHVSIVGHVANTLVFLGLIGTVIGFIIALAGVDPEAARGVENVAPMVSSLIDGMGVALYTTLVGAVLHVWLIVGHRMLATGTLHLYNAIVELGERRARSL